MTPNIARIDEIGRLFRGRRVLITGATGFIGRALRDLLSSTGAHLFVTSRRPAPGGHAVGREGASVTTLATDLSQSGAFERVFSAVTPDVTFNLVGYGVARDERDPTLAERLNASLVAEIGDTIARAHQKTDWPGQRFIHLGSAFEYGSVEGNVHEDSVCNPTSLYARTKLQGTDRLAELRRATALAAVTLRVATVYGPGEHAHRLLPSLIRAARTGEVLPLTAGEQERDFTFVGNVAEGAMRMAAASNLPWDVVNVATGRLSSVREFATTAMDLLGMDAKMVAFGAIPYREDEVWQGAIDVGRLEQAVAWRPGTPIVVGIRRTINGDNATHGIS